MLSLKSTNQHFLTKSKVNLGYEHTQGLFLADFIAVTYWVIFPMPKSIFFPNVWRKIPNFKSEKKRRKIIIFIMVKVGLKLLNIQNCTVSYNTPCNGDYKLTLQLNSDKYMMYFMICNIAKSTKKFPIFDIFGLKFPIPGVWVIVPKW